MGNFIIYSATDGDTTRKIVREQELDLVLIDLKLKDEDGIEIIKQIRSYNKTMPIIAISAYVMSEMKKSVIDAGGNDFISKPITDLNEFTKTVLGYL